MRSNTIVFLVCVMMFVHTSMAMYGLCSTNWFSEVDCFDNNDECHQMGGDCRHPGVGDHGEGCVCIKETFRNDKWEFETLTKDHFRGKGQLFPPFH